MIDPHYPNYAKMLGKIQEYIDVHPRHNSAIAGSALKEVIQEKFGDGIMSAIDFTMDVEKVEDSKGDRVKIVMSGKFLSYKKW